ncbi:MAG: Dyp-type peroxidase [Paracoccus sp. (in: a-proteobacteria)]|nr:Dyp-type peroxidase [Paracoccus sp. (in: a-proteobacteria)]
MRAPDLHLVHRLKGRHPFGVILNGQPGRGQIAFQPDTAPDDDRSAVPARVMARIDPDNRAAVCPSVHDAQGHIVTTEPQAVTASLTSSAIFLVLTVNDTEAATRAVQDLLADLAGLVRATGFRRPSGELSCVTGIGARVWGRLFPGPRPRELAPFDAIEGVHLAPSTPGDLLFHIRGTAVDMCFELETHILNRLAGHVVVIDETPGFRYFDSRDLLGFVDGTENPVGPAREAAVLIGDEDPTFAGGSYVITQKYLHDLAKWDAIPTEQQERIIGRRKLSDVELPDAEKPGYAHNVLNVIEDEDGNQLDILRDNMPFGSPASGAFGTYFIGYARSPSRTIRMLNNMFIGLPPGNYDRILDVSTPVTGTLFFVPPADMLERAGQVAPPSEAAPEPEPAPAPTPATPAASLGIGSLKGS